jgi:hypothetical protein
MFSPEAVSRSPYLMLLTHVEVKQIVADGVIVNFLLNMSEGKISKMVGLQVKLKGQLWVVNS